MAPPCWTTKPSLARYILLVLLHISQLSSSKPCGLNLSLLSEPTTLPTSIYLPYTSKPLFLPHPQVARTLRTYTETSKPSDQPTLLVLYSYSTLLYPGTQATLGTLYYCRCCQSCTPVRQSATTHCYLGRQEVADCDSPSQVQVPPFHAMAN